MIDNAAGFPADDYTPYGYLDLPGHTRRLSPKGVMRSAGVGFRWHFPAFAATYGGRRDRYQAGLRLAGVRPEDTAVRHHSSRLMIFEQAVDDGSVEAAWFMIDDDCLALRLTTPPGRRIELIADYQRTVSADGKWGESGLLARPGAAGQVLQSFEDGEAFVVAGAEPESITGAPEIRQAGDAWVVLGRSGDRVGLTARLSVRSPTGTAWLLMARGATADLASSRLPSVATAESILVRRLAEDDAFWSAAPRLAGDWPEHWRRGLVYDLDTLRMMIKEPVGDYRHRWDAMQIQSPRTVLAEAAMDALALSWADPAAARDLLAGCFLDAALPQVPCSREDGTYNMVSADGSVCGTGPQWGFPFLVLRRLAATLADPTPWLAELYPRLAGYLDWWLTERRDPDGWLVHACSWESGQDLSPRFGDQPVGGGHPTWQLRPVDLHAAAAHAAGVLAEVAGSVAPADVPRWRAAERELTELTGRLWTGDRFADLDARTGRSTEIDDVMLWSPVALGLGTTEQRGAAGRSVLDPADLVWPMFVWTPVLAARQAGRRDTAAELAAAVVDRAYRHWDRRDHDGSSTLPGIACEYWPVHGRCGGEGYGWGAFTTELLLGEIVGLVITADTVTVSPWLPPELREPGRAYTVTVGPPDDRLRFTLRPDGDTGVAIDGPDGTRTIPWGDTVSWPRRTP